MEFSTDCLTDQPTNRLIPSDKCNSITAKTTYRLDIFTAQCHFGYRGAFWLAAVHTMHSLWTHQCPHSSLLTAKSGNLALVHDGFPS